MCILNLQHHFRFKGAEFYTARITGNACLLLTTVYGLWPVVKPLARLCEPLPMVMGTLNNRSDR